ncbi:MAG: KamA family radical SAM protein [Planctomycetes bacterium]|nr:KamA family radical SAM protein [Planctomycetota bacterium]
MNDGGTGDCECSSTEDEPPNLSRPFLVPLSLSLTPDDGSQAVAPFSPALSATLLTEADSPRKRNGHHPPNGRHSNGHRFSALSGGAPPVRIVVHRALSEDRSRTANPRTDFFRERFFPEAGDDDWNDWRWQSRHRIRTLAQFEQFVRLSESEREALVGGGTMLPVGVTPYYMSLLDPDDPAQPLRKTVIPTTAEFVRTAGEADDPLGEDGHSPVPGLVHRYPDRVLLLPLDFCSTYCRYCTRSRVVGHGEIVPNEARLEAIFQYLEKATEVRDVLISGGDPLALSDDKLDWLLGRLRAIEHIEFVRIGTKMPAVLPQRVTPELCQVLRKYHPLWMSLHFLHPDECTPESRAACERLADAGIPLGSQTVLLSGVNDSVETMKQLVHKLLLMRVRPYYLYQCDPISGSSHFRTPVAKGLEIIEGLRGHTTGYAVPTYVIDAPGGGGKIPLQPQYVAGRDGEWLLLRNFEGKTFRYPDPQGV